MRITKSAIFITVYLLLFSSSDVSGQTEVYNWYLLKSIPQLNETQAKEITTHIGNYQLGIVCWFNEKSNTFSVKSAAPIAMEALIIAINDMGFFLADITFGETSITDQSCEKCTEVFQKNLWLSQLPGGNYLMGGGNILISRTEFNQLPENKKQAVLNDPNYLITEE